MKFLLVILLMGIILVSGCALYDGQQPATPAASAQTAPATSTAPQGELKEFTVEGSEFKFSPASISINKGDRVKVTFKNVGNAGHNFVIGDLGVSTRIISAGSTDTVEFTADKSGTFAFYCSVPGHRAGGMEGQISIS